MKRYKKAIERLGEDFVNGGIRKYSSRESQAYETGVAGDKVVEPAAAYVRTPSEKIIESDNGSYIILGRDRPADRLSGYGGKGDTQCASIDVVVGRLGGSNRKFSNGVRVWANPNFQKDAARIYISQKTDVDDNFKLAQGSGNAKTKSAIGLKADAVRIMARENVKIVTGLDNENSQGGVKIAKYGIDLIANNDDKSLQSMVKGENLLEALSAIVDYIDSVLGVIESFMRNQTAINMALAFHTHLSPGPTLAIPGTPTLPSVELGAVATSASITMTSESYSSLVANKANAAILKVNYLSPVGEKYVNSRYNKVN